MITQGMPQFWRYQVREEPPLIESYCLICNTFVAASQSQLHLDNVELLHRLKCQTPWEDSEETS